MNSRYPLIAMTLLLLVPILSFAQRSAMDWLNAVDRNQVLESAKYTSVMTVHLPSGQERSFSMKGHTVGDNFALVEYVEPARDAGTRYLRRDDQLWIYFPRVDRTMLVQGHMLREGVQGSDMSYEDMTQSSSWADDYNASIIAETDSTAQIRMEAKDMTVSYPFREITIDKRREVATRVLNYDASEYLIKEMLVERMEPAGDRWFPVSTMIRSHLTEDKWTRFEITDIIFDVPYNDSDFTKASLEKVGDF
jgi:Outer membrane lipoprotein-sorting protein